MSSREFNQDTAGAKRMAEATPVIVTERGNPTHVLMSYSEYQKLVGPKRNLMDCFTSGRDAGDDLDPPQFRGFGARPAELS